jgi:SAM-dependent methyltransferase
MDERTGPPGGYVLGHAAREQRRLVTQADISRPKTEALLRDAGVGPGMRVLDAGCGAGDVAFLVAELVGPDGEIVGIDRSADVLATARGRAEALGLRQVSFVEGDAGTIVPEGAFDAVVGRLVLMYVADPVAVLRHLAGLVRPGGVVAFQELNIAAWAWPPAPVFERCWRWAVEAFARSGARPDMGPRLFKTFVDAGLPAPQVRMDGNCGGGPDFVGYELVAETVRTLLPAIERCGIATAAEVDVETLAERMRAEVVAGGGAISPSVFWGVWSRTPAG